jgi:hypothetical protein
MCGTPTGIIPQGICKSLCEPHAVSQLRCVLTPGRVSRVLNAPDKGPLSLEISTRLPVQGFTRHIFPNWESGIHPG